MARFRQAWIEVFACVALVSAASTLTAQTYRFEAESGSFGGASIQTSTAGFSGTGYVTFSNNSTTSYVQVGAAVPNGLYEMWVGYNSPFGFKGYDYQVNQVSGSGGLDGNGNQWGTDRAGVFDLTLPTNTLRINRGWGWYNVDYFELRPFAPPALLPVSAHLSDAQAGARTQILMNYLVSQYGRKSLSGQQHQSSQNLSFPVANYISKSGGIVPAIRGGDFIEYSPTRLQYGANPRNESEQTIQWAKQTGGIATMMWHWNAPANLVNTPCGSICGDNDWPWWRGFYTQGTTFNLPGALANPSGSDYQLILRDIDAIAVQLQKFEDAGVPVIWRPLHEAQGTWFWWGAHGPDTFKQLWRLMHDRLTDHHGLHNLIWEFTSSNAEGNHLDWYPGDDVVDMISLDIYTNATDPMNGPWYDVLAHYNGRKIIALSETGTLPNADTMNKWGIEWSYFSPWTGSFVDAMSAADLQALLNHNDIVTLNELPLMPWNSLAPSPGDFNRDGTVNAADYTIWRDSMGQIGFGLVADANFNGQVDVGDYDIWRANFGNSSATATSTAGIPEPTSLLLLGIAIIVGLTMMRS
jgi:mannan endo-1,4-beta-mannosidase